MIDTAALREKVLDLAIRGKLVPQDPTDEPASVLLERIHEQKLQMVREGKLKAKDVKDDTIIFKGDDNCYYEKFSDGTIKNIQDEIPFDLPDGWSWSGLNSICSLISDIDHKMPKSVNDGVLFLSAKDLLNDGTINYDIDVKRISEADYLRLSKKAAPQINDIIYSRIGVCLGKARVVNRNVRFLVSYSCCTIRPLMIDSTFLALILDGNFVLKQAKKETQSVGVPDLGIKNIKDFLIPIPPLNEQSRIDACLKIALSLVDNISYNATCVDEDIDVLQSRILELAIQGKLVPQDENDEPASVLLERIRAERKAKLGKKYVESYIYKGDDNCYYEKVGNISKKISEEMPFGLPFGWCWITLKEIATITSGKTPKNEQITDFGNIPYFKVGDMNLPGNEIFMEVVQYYVNDCYTGITFPKNSFIFPKNGGALLTNKKRILKQESLVDLNTGVLIPSSAVNNEFMFYLFSTVDFTKNYKGSTIPTIDNEMIGNIVFALPPIEEQSRIVQKIKAIMSILKGGD